MTPELQKYYESRFDMCASKGWNDLIEDVKEMVKVYSDLTKISSVDELYKRQGQLDILNWIITLKDVSERAYEELNAETI